MDEEIRILAATRLNLSPNICLALPDAGKQSRFLTLGTESANKTHIGPQAADNKLAPADMLLR
ncbi:hypothetical protein [Rhizobium sp. Root482]|uniref:hypothetical protein n=1 Tax=Rhizobium sp. Root482 TaxID=1736543 RepID=UPI0006FD6FD9|nr:hypothetical protein [Rhizobium sp. Root482]KQY19612.1 hypothetical protein ASD31_04115 [Rhizobium sp. Root482]